MMNRITVAILLAVALAPGCHNGFGEEKSSDNTKATSPITEAEARRLASQYVNKHFAGHVWNTSLGKRKFGPVGPRSWNGVVTDGNRLRLRCGGTRGQEFTVSMKLDGTNIKVEYHGYALR